ncbi:MAG TPA: type II toxin-antitoxin system PemK/MazF family toxin [Candidatus Baltobacteraceae bacterium]|nr:type II toxin-antitoxin system PemK/MazF family toxin [Candidatus Baltobacteraceae bacterium]
MPLFPGVIPHPGDVYMCDFSGYIVPEMVKKRRVIVISPRNAGTAPLAVVVPVSSTRPDPPSNVHVRLPGENIYRCFYGKQEVWAKADMIAHVRFDRLDRVRVPQLDEHGAPIERSARYIPTVRLSAEHLQEVRVAVLHAIGLGGLAIHA